MQAYQDALPASNTTVVLSPDSEFFRYFMSTRRRGSEGEEAVMDVPRFAGEGHEFAVGLNVVAHHLSTRFATSAPAAPAMEIPSV